ncbi:MAG: hypothetical protein K6C13_12235 [Oscillospiraceae bacterium]|nr:hypothetical protein [Oscillospiraceae bacterium]
MKCFRAILLCGYPSYRGTAIITAAQIAKICSAFLLIAALVIYGSEYGLTGVQGAAFGSSQAVCMVIYLLSAVFSAKNIISKSEEKAKNMKYILNIAANIFMVCGSVFFEMFRFRGC